MIPLKSAQSVCLDIVPRQKHILKVRLNKVFISCLFVMLNGAALDHWQCISFMYRILSYIVKSDFQLKTEYIFCSCRAPSLLIQRVSTASKAKLGQTLWFSTKLECSFVELPPFFGLFSQLFTENKISHHFMATEQSDTALQCLQLTLLALSSPPSIWESEQSRGG